MCNVIKVTPFRVFMSCRFPVSTLASVCTHLGDALGLDIITSDRPETSEIIDKVKQDIENSEGVLFLLENDEDASVQQISDWIKAEYGVARGMNKPFAIITTDPSLLPSVFAKDHEYLDLSNKTADDRAVFLTKYLASFKRKLEAFTITSVDPVEPTYVRDFLKHRVKVSAEGRLRYETQVKLTCMKDGLADVRHSIHMNYSLCWLNENAHTRPMVELIIEDANHNFILEPIASSPQKFSWKINIKPPLRRGETTTFGWRSEFLHYLPLSKEELRPALETPGYPFAEGGVEHHYFINNPTNLLVLRVEFEDGSLIGDPVKAYAFVGRTFSIDSLDHDECRRIQGGLATEGFLGRREISLTVKEPRFGYNYAIWWQLSK